MGVAKELVELGFKSIKPAVKNFMETGLAKTDGKKLVHMLKSDPPKFNEMYSTMDTFTKTGNEQVGLGIIKELDKYGDDLEELNTASKVQDLSWVGDRKTSELSQAGMRKNVMQYGYNKRLQDPDIPPSEITQGFKEEMGTITYGGEPQKVVSGGSKPTKNTEISEAGQRRLQVQAVAENQARKDKTVKVRKKHKVTSAYTDMKKAAAVENRKVLKNAKAQGMKTTKGQQFVSVEHDVAISHANKWWDKVGNIGNESENLFIQRNQLARQFKDNIENWFYPKSKDFVIKSDRSNLKDLIIVNIDTGQEVLRIPMPDDFKTGIPDNITQQLKELIGK